MIMTWRQTVALVITTVYLLAVVSPLASFAIQSRQMKVITGKCSGDCRLDGCSSERSAAHTCCCWQKKQDETRKPRLHFISGCCAKKPAEPPKIMAGCCAPKGQNVKSEGPRSESVPGDSLPKKRVTISKSPCGSGKLFALLNVESPPHLPIFFSEVIPVPEQSILPSIHPDRLTSRYGEPPDLPPIISHLTR